LSEEVGQVAKKKGKKAKMRLGEEKVHLNKDDQEYVA